MKFLLDNSPKGSKLSTLLAAPARRGVGKEMSHFLSEGGQSPPSLGGKKPLTGFLPTKLNTARARGGGLLLQTRHACVRAQVILC